MHARSLSLGLRRVMLAALAAPSVACGGVVLGNGDAGDDGAVPVCDAVQVLDAGNVGCGGKTLQLSNAAACGISGSGQVAQSVCQSLCGGQEYTCSFDSSTDILECQSFCTGRLPAALRGDFGRAATPDAVGEYLARAAYLEAAAVDAFAILVAELRAHGAPTRLLQSARRAGADEVRHAREVGDLARAFGADVETPKVARGPARPLVEIAIENAVEGCVRETFGALVASWQAEHARDLRVRRTMKRIARDETRHAALGWRIFDWSMARLSPSERARVDDAMRAAIDELESSFAVPPARALETTLGLPSASRALALVGAMRGEIWPAQAA